MRCVDCKFHKAFPTTNIHWCEATKKHRRISDEDAYVDAPCKVADRKTEKTVDDLIRKSDVLETYADLYDIFDDNKAIQEELHKVFDKINDISTVESNNSEKPNNCEPLNYCDDCFYTDTCDSKEFSYACTSKATISKMEQVDKDINVRSKDEPRIDCRDCKQWEYSGWLGYGCKRQRYDNKGCKFEPKDEPTTQTETQNSNLTFEKADEPQTKLCRECDDYAGDRMYCASNHIVYDFSTSKENCEPQTEDEILREQCRAFMGIVEQTKRGE